MTVHRRNPSGRRPTWRRILSLATIAMVALVACGDDADVGTDVPPDARPLESRLAGRTFWSERVADADGGRSLVEGTTIVLTFGEGQVGAHAGCNSMGGTVRFEDDLLVTGGLSTTEMGCDPALHEQDAWIAEFLGSRPRVALDGDRLTLATDARTIEFVDRAVADPDRPLAGTEWTVDTLVEGEAASSVPEGVTATIVIDEDGTLRVDAGCNTGEGRATIDRATIAVVELAVTDMACEPHVMEVERVVLAVFGAGPDTGIHYEIEGPRLFLDTGDYGLGFRAGS